MRFVVALKLLIAAATLVATPGIAMAAPLLTERAERAVKIGASVESTRAFYAGATRTRFDPIHGLQVEYNAPDGRTYLWYAGNSAVLKGAWKVETGTTPSGRDAARICYLYGPNSYDPADGSTGGAWGCQWASVGVMTTKERVAGDVFGLARSPRPPFVLPRRSMTIGELQAGGGAGSERVDPVATAPRIPPRFDPVACHAPGLDPAAQSLCMRNMMHAHIGAMHAYLVGIRGQQCEGLNGADAFERAQGLSVHRHADCGR